MIVKLKHFKHCMLITYYVLYIYYMYTLKCLYAVDVDCFNTSQVVIFYTVPFLYCRNSIMRILMGTGVRRKTRWAFLD